MLIALLLIFIGYRIYDIAVNAAQDFSLFFRTGFDLYRIDLLKQLYRQLPNNLADERNMWLSISTFLIAGERLIFDERKVNYPAYKYYDNNDEKTENIGKEKREKKNPNY